MRLVRVPNKSKGGVHCMAGPKGVGETSAPPRSVCGAESVDRFAQSDSRSATNETKSREAAPAGVDVIRDRLQKAILEQRLPPGTKLGEDRVADIFGASRARVRQALTRLAHEQLVEILPQRGAFVARPTLQQAKDVFEARRLIEPAVVERLIATQTPAKIRRLRQHIEKEEVARSDGDARAVIRLSGEFHCLLAELAGNSALVRTMRELSAVTCLIISLYNVRTSRSCRADEHADLIDAIANRQASLARQLVLEHLQHIEGALLLHDGGVHIDLENILGNP